MLELSGVLLLSCLSAVLTAYLVTRKTDHQCQCKEKLAPSGPVSIRSFVKDKFGNIIKQEKRFPRHGDDSAAHLAEQKERDK